MIVVLHNIRSSHNVGSIFRTSDAVGVEKIYLCGITPTPLDAFKRKNTHLAKVSLGAEESVQWERYDSCEDLLIKLKKEGNIIIGVEQANNSVSYKDKSLLSIDDKRKVVVMGSEIEGISQDILDICDYIVEIPMKGKKESLNVAVAYGVIAFELLSV